MVLLPGKKNTLCKIQRSNQTLSPSTCKNMIDNLPKNVYNLHLKTMTQIIKQVRHSGFNVFLFVITLLVKLNN